MTRILMVCLGNICRSPLAQGILESKLPKDQFFVDSAGTASYHVGSQPDYRSIEVARLNNIDIKDQRARAFNIFDFENFDIIYAMDQSNYTDIISMANSKSDVAKVRLLLEEYPNNAETDVPDPYYGNMMDFQKVYDLLEVTCNALSEKLLNKS